jgi:coenzyme F420-reducing hydrogenase delta subunit
MTNISSAQGMQFAQTAKAFTEQVAALGPNPLKNENQAKINITEQIT